MTKKEPERRGDSSYRKKGLTKALVIHVSPPTHSALEKLAKSEERSLQVTVRRILEDFLKAKES